jgi:hypothetical protein
MLERLDQSISSFMKPNHEFTSTIEEDPVLEKLFNQPNGFDTEIADRKASNSAYLGNTLETHPEFIFNNGACHIYAVCLKNADSRFVLRALSRHGRQDGRHVYCKLGEWAIDANGIQLESELIDKWVQKLGENLFPFEVSVDELMKNSRDGSKPVNVRGHSLDEPFVSRAIEKAEIHIAEHLLEWRRLIGVGQLESL